MAPSGSTTPGTETPTTLVAPDPEGLPSVTWRTRCTTCRAMAAPPVADVGCRVSASGRPRASVNDTRMLLPPMSTPTAVPAWSDTSYSEAERPGSPTRWPTSVDQAELGEALDRGEHRRPGQVARQRDLRPAHGLALRQQVGQHPLGAGQARRRTVSRGTS